MTEKCKKWRHKRKGTGNQILCSFFVYYLNDIQSKMFFLIIYTIKSKSR